MTTDMVSFPPIEQPKPPTKEEAVSCLENWAKHEYISDMALSLVNANARVLGLPVDSRGYIHPIDGETHEESLARFEPYKPTYDKIMAAHRRYRELI